MSSYRIKFVCFYLKIMKKIVKLEYRVNLVTSGPGLIPCLFLSVLYCVSINLSKSSNSSELMDLFSHRNAKQDQ